MDRGVHEPTYAGAQSACVTGGRPPASGLTHVFGLGSHPGLWSDDFEARIIETAALSRWRAPRRRRRADDSEQKVIATGRPAATWIGRSATAEPSCSCNPSVHPVALRDAPIGYRATGVDERHGREIAEAFINADLSNPLLPTKEGP